ncbi:hypothetical protein K0M31_011502, partial [Melipona bicolor]
RVHEGVWFILREELSKKKEGRKEKNEKIEGDLRRKNVALAVRSLCIYSAARPTIFLRSDAVKKSKTIDSTRQIAILNKPDIAWKRF